MVAYLFLSRVRGGVFREWASSDHYLKVPCHRRTVKWIRLVEVKSTKFSVPDP